MKKTILLLAAVVAFGLSGSAQSNPKTNNRIKNHKNEKEVKTLVTYFSASGTTKQVAVTLAEILGADICAIEPSEPYTEADLDWTNKKSRSSVEMQDPNSRPDLAKPEIAPDDYDVIYIGFPIWWYTAPTLIKSYLDSYVFDGKTVIPFATSGGSGIEKACKDLAASYPRIKWRPGRLLNNPTESELKSWVKENRK